MDEINALIYCISKHAFHDKDNKAKPILDEVLEYHCCVAYLKICMPYCYIFQHRFEAKFLFMKMPNKSMKVVVLHVMCTSEAP